jgi:hypothetical protein
LGPRNRSHPKGATSGRWLGGGKWTLSAVAINVRFRIDEVERLFSAFRDNFRLFDAAGRAVEGTGGAS